VFRWLLLVLVFVALAFGLLVGVLNPDQVSFDLYWVQGQGPLGALLVAAFAAGGTVMWVLSVLTRWMRLKKRR